MVEWAMTSTRLPAALACLLLAGLAGAARADEASDCSAGAGTLLTGVALGAPTFARGKPLRGIELSHTHLRIRGDADGKVYDLAIDNVFAAGYQPHDERVPAPLDTIAAGQHVEACGLPYTGGMHWVHTNCGDTPTHADPDGWLKLLAADGTPGANLEDSQTYCYLWPKKKSSHSRHRHH
jgi:hypothetical protein